MVVVQISAKGFYPFPILCESFVSSRLTCILEVAIDRIGPSRTSLVEVDCILHGIVHGRMLN